MRGRLMRWLPPVYTPCSYTEILTWDVDLRICFFALVLLLVWVLMWKKTANNYFLLIFIYTIMNFFPGGGTTTTTRHFAAWEQTTHFPRGHHTHPLLAASASLNSSSPLIRPIPNRLASPPRSPLLTSEAKPSLTSSPQGLNLIKLGKIYTC